MFFFSSRRRHTRCSRDWSSDVCSSDLGVEAELVAQCDEALTRNAAPLEVVERGGGPEVGVAVEGGEAAVQDRIGPLLEIGRASCRERGLMPAVAETCKDRTWVTSKREV